MSPYVVSDHVLDRNLSTSLTPTFWGALTIVSFDSLDSDSPQSGLIPEKNNPTQLSTSSKGSEDTNTPLSKSVDLPAVPHRRLYFYDGNITFRVEGLLYRLHRSLLCRGSRKFEGLISQLSTQQESSTSPIPLNDVKSLEFDAFLSVIYPQNYNTLERHTFEEWSSILNLSTRWGFTSIRDLAIRCITFPDPLKKLLLARKNAIDMWIQPALLELCQRPLPLSLEEARLMDFEDVMLVGCVRPTVRSSALTVGAAGIRSCIQGWKGGEPWNSVSMAGPSSVPAPAPPLEELQDKAPASLPPPTDTEDTAPTGINGLYRGSTIQKRRKGKGMR